MKIENRYYFGVAALFMILGLAASCTRNLSVEPSIAVSVNTPTQTNTVPPTLTFTGSPTNTGVFTNTFTMTFTSTPTVTFTSSFTPIGPSYTPTFSFTPSNTGTSTFTSTNTNTPTNTLTFTNTSTPTNTPTNTNTFTSTPTNTNTPAPTIIFENWDGPSNNGTYPGGNMWAAFAACAAPSYICNPAASVPMTVCYDTNTADTHNASYACWHTQIGWNSCGIGDYAQEGIDSAYGGDYGFPVSIDSSTLAVPVAGGVPVSISIWLKSSIAGQQFSLFFADTSGSGSGTQLHIANYYNGTGSKFILTIPTANTWTNFMLPLTAGTSVWSYDPTLMNWSSILDIATVFYAPPGCVASPPTPEDIYMDDYGFVP